MALKKYIGARYTPNFAGEWNSANQYGALSVVYTDNRSYVARQNVPAGTPITNTQYWIQSSDWNAQVAEYNQKVDGYAQNVEQYNQSVNQYNENINQFYADTIHAFDTKNDMINDKALAVGQVAITCGDKALGDGKGAYYQIVSSASLTAVALVNGLYAKPFTLQATDVSAFQKAVDEYKEETDTQIATIQNSFAEFKSQTTAENDAFKNAVEAVSLDVYNTKTNLSEASTLDAGKTVLTAGETAIGDGKGSFYKVEQGSVSGEGNVPLGNGNTAVPFQLMPYSGFVNTINTVTAQLNDSYTRIFKPENYQTGVPLYYDEWVAQSSGATGTVSTPIIEIVSPPIVVSRLINITGDIEAPVVAAVTTEIPIGIINIHHTSTSSVQKEYVTFRFRIQLKPAETGVIYTVGGTNYTIANPSILNTEIQFDKDVLLGEYAALNSRYYIALGFGSQLNYSGVVDMSNQTCTLKGNPSVSRLYYCSYIRTETQSN